MSILKLDLKGTADNVLVNTKDILYVLPNGSFSCQITMRDGTTIDIDESLDDLYYELIEET